jgi:hypothetical protein
MHIHSSMIVVYAMIPWCLIFQYYTLAIYISVRLWWLLLFLQLRSFLASNIIHMHTHMHTHTLIQVSFKFDFSFFIKNYAYWYLDWFWWKTLSSGCVFSTNVRYVSHCFYVHLYFLFNIKFTIFLYKPCPHVKQHMCEIYLSEIYVVLTLFAFLYI